MKQEKLEEAKRLYQTANADQRYVLESLFPELKESEDERIRKALLEMVHDTTGDGLWVDYNIHKEEALAWLEKQGEQKPTDKVEPKFHEGDWVVDKNGTVRQILSYKDGIYKHTDGYSATIFEDEWRMWDIAKDAKDGDVLSDGTTIFIFKDLLSDGSVMSYCDYDTDSGESDAFCPLSVNLICSKITPATKEQRDLLFQKMRESGYEWSDEDRKLIRIAQKSQRIMAAEAKESLYGKPAWR